MTDAAGKPAWEDAALVVALFAVDPVGLGGVALRGLPGPARDAWLALLRHLLPAGTPLRRVPLQIPDGRLLGGLDLAATLQAGRPVAERGLLAEADGGVILLAMAERLGAGMAARLGAVLDRGEVVVERDGLALVLPTRLGVVALDEGLEAEERPPAALLDRLACHLDLTGLRPAASLEPMEPAYIAAARARLPGITVDDQIVEALCATAAALGIGSLRAPLLALRLAQAAAALAGLVAVGEAEARLAAHLVLGPRAVTLPAEAASPEPAPPDGTPGEDTAETPPDPEAEGDALPSLEDILLAAAQAAIPAGLLSQLRLAGQAPSRGAAQGRAGALQHSARRGRPIGTRPGTLGNGARLNLVETLRAAAPWQRLRRLELAAGSKRIQVRSDDFRITRFRQRSETTTIFVVDASGSSALNRLAEAKGAVELLLADCYVRRDQVALLAFRGTAAELLLPPTPSLLRAKRSLAGLPGGGGTPLATAIDAAGVLAGQVRRQGRTPVVVFLTDGRGNVARDGTPGRTRAAEEAMVAARGLRAAGLTVLLVDTSPRPQPLARTLADAMGARCLPLPQADAVSLNLAVRAAAGS